MWNSAKSIINLILFTLCLNHITNTYVSGKLKLLLFVDGMHLFFGGKSVKWLRSIDCLLILAKQITWYSVTQNINYRYKNQIHSVHRNVSKKSLVLYNVKYKLIIYILCNAHQYYYYHFYVCERWVLHINQGVIY